ncbi:MAG: CPBP family intramembrane metalloprotease [Candidatus Wallbacteria bacterium]|nr:CPBP family intramembrane metalloprotease [Candidatus Wallbacteria bacterium]
MKRYFQETRELRYNFLMALPLLIVYEYEAFHLNHSDVAGIRNNADICVKNCMAYFHIEGHLAVAFLLCLTALLIYRRERDRQVNLIYFFFMLAESLVYAVSLQPAVEKLRVLLSVSRRVQFVSCLGAGIYEEFLFRVLFFSGCFRLLIKVLPIRWFVFWLSAVVSSAAFSYFHYMGDLAEKFNPDIFFYRFLAGMILCLLYYCRGFGIACYTHVIYNLMVFYQLYVWKWWQWTGV